MKPRQPTQRIGPFLLVGALLGMTPTLADGVPNLRHPDLGFWNFIGGLMGGALVGAIAGTFLYIYLPRLLNRINRQR
jgi:hypothetical protein